MTSLTIGDLAQSFQLRRDNARLKDDMHAAGARAVDRPQVRPVARPTRGDFGPLAAIERSSGRSKAYKTAKTEAALFAEAHAAVARADPT